MDCVIHFMLSDMFEKKQHPSLHWILFGKLPHSLSVFITYCIRQHNNISDIYLHDHAIHLHLLLMFMQISENF